MTVTMPTRVEGSYSHLAPNISGSILLSLSLILAACGSGFEDGFITQTLPDGRIFVSNPPPEDPLGGPEWQLIEDMRLGSVHDSGPEIFGRISALEADLEGHVYVADNQAGEVRVFDNEGQYKFAFGGQGSGPGEFRMISGMGRDDQGTIWVMDPINARLTGFDFNGKLRATHTRALNLYATIPWAGRFDSNGNLYDREPARLTGGERRYAIIRYSIGDQRKLRPLDTLLLPEIQTATYSYKGNDGPTSISFTSNIPFSPMLIHNISPEGDIWLANTGEYRLHRITIEGDTTHTIELRTPLPRLSSAERDSIMLMTGLSAGEIPQTKAAIHSFLIDDTGRIWVRPYLEGRTDLPVWDLFEAEGRHLGRIRTPLPLSTDDPPPIARHSSILGVVRDELGVQYVVRMRLEKSSGRSLNSEQ